MDLPSLRRETIYGMPAADQIMFNRYYVLGYSYYFRQAKWALEIVDPDNLGIGRSDSFRQDHRIPEIFRAGRVDYSVFRSHYLISSIFRCRVNCPAFSRLTYRPLATSLPCSFRPSQRKL